MIASRRSAKNILCARDLLSWWSEAERREVR
jgi:hypothetical protein